MTLTCEGGVGGVQYSNDRMRCLQMAACCAFGCAVEVCRCTHYAQQSVKCTTLLSSVLHGHLCFSLYG